MNKVERETAINLAPSSRAIHPNDNEVKNDAPSPLSIHGDRAYLGDFSMAGRQNLQSNLHPGGKEFSLRRSKHPMCEAIGWSTIL